MRRWLRPALSVLPPGLLPRLLLALLPLCATPATSQPAARSPFDDEPPGAAPAPGKTPYAGPQYPGKPPPLGARGEGSAPESPFGAAPRLAPSNPRETGRLASSGTGFVAAPGRIVTNNHVVEGCGRMMARNARNVKQQATVLATDPQRDLALLSLPDDFGPPLAFRDAPAVRRGETVVTYGFPLTGLLSSGPSLTAGDVSALTGLRDNPRNYTITAPVQPGNSGGPLLDSQGSVIGVVVTKLNAARVAQMTGGDIPQNVNFAVKGSEVLNFLRANNVRPRTAASTGPDLRNSDVGDIANPSTVFLECYK